MPSFDLPENTFLGRRKAPLPTPTTVKMPEKSQLTVVKRDREAKVKHVESSVEIEPEIAMEPEEPEKTTIGKIPDMNKLGHKDDLTTQKEALATVDQIPVGQIDETIDKSIHESMEEVTQTEEQPGEYSCECGVKFSSVGWLVRHMRSCVKDIICDICGKTFKSSKTLKKHKKMIHTKAFQCDQCDESFTTPKKLVRHTRSFHEATILCEICSAAFKNKNSLRYHRKKFHKVKLNTKEKPNLETKRQDKKVLKSKDEHASCNKHKTKQQKSEYQCLQCPKSFATSSGLRKHKIAHKKLVDQSNTNEKNDKAVRLENLAVADDFERIEVVLVEDGNETSIGTAVIIGSVVSGVGNGELASVPEGVNSKELRGSLDSEHTGDIIISEHTIEGSINNEYVISGINNEDTGDRNNNEGAEEVIFKPRLPKLRL